MIERLFESLAWRAWVGFVDATLIVLGVWWLREREMPWFPSSVMFVLLTVVWIGAFAKEAFRD